MKKKTVIILVSALLIISFYVAQFLVSHNLYLIGSKSYFVASFDFFIEQLSLVGGLTNYITSLISQFIHINYLGAVILSVLVALNFVLLGQINKRINRNKQDVLVFSLFPSLYFLSEISSSSLSIEHFVGLTIVFLFLLKETKNIIINILITALCYYLIGDISIIYPLILLFNSDIKHRYVPLLIFVFSPFIYALIKINSFSTAYNGFLNPNFQYYVAFAIIPLLASRLIPNLKNKLRYSLIIVFLLLLSFATSYKFVKGYSYKEKLMILMGKAMSESRYDDLLEIANKYPSKNILKSYAVNLALLSTDRLPYDILKYPQSYGLNGLFFGNLGGQLKNDYAHYIYAKLGMYNEAHRLIWESSMVHGLNRINLNAIVEYNEKLGRDKIATKFRKLLESTPLNHDFKVINESQSIVIDTNNIRFNNPYNICVDLTYLASVTTLTKNQADYLFVGLLLSNRVLDFAEHINYITKYYKSQPLPQIYDEALVMLKAVMQKEDFEELGVQPSELAQQRYLDYTRMHKAANGSATELKKYADTYFYYMNFISPYGTKVISK